MGTDRWITSVNKRCAVALTDTAMMAPTNVGRGTGYAVMRVADLVIYSCYCSSNFTIDAFISFLDGLETDIRRRSPVDLLVAGDFNAKSYAWDSAREDTRRGLLLDFAASLGLWAENVGSMPTF